MSACSLLGEPRSRSPPLMSISTALLTYRPLGELLRTHTKRERFPMSGADYSALCTAPTCSWVLRLISDQFPVRLPLSCTPNSAHCAECMPYQRCPRKFVKRRRNSCSILRLCVMAIHHMDAAQQLAATPAHKVASKGEFLRCCGGDANRRQCIIASAWICCVVRPMGSCPSQASGSAHCGHVNFCSGARWSVPSGSQDCLPE